MKRVILLSLIFLMSIVAVNAEIAYDNINDDYLWRESIEPIVIITPEVEAKALFSAELVCEEFEAIYYLQPVSLIPDKDIKINIPGFETFNKTNGTCVIDFYIDSLIGARIEKTWTDEFLVTDERVAPQINDSGVIEPEDEETDDEEDETEEEVIEEEPEKPRSGKGFYIFLLLVVLIGSIFVYFKLKFKNKNNFNRGWKL